jgi:hypothetical protein
MKIKKSDYILSTAAIRERCQKLFDLNVKGQGHFNYHPEKWDLVVSYVHQVILENYPDLNIPFHSRLAHFRAGEVKRLEWTEFGFKDLSPLEKVRMLIDLIIPSVLLDAGAGNEWKWLEEKTSKTFTRSEGLGVASFHMFLNKSFSSRQLFQTDAHGLLSLTLEQLKKDFQVTDNNPLTGAVGRLNLLQSLGTTIKNNPAVFPNQRPSDLLDTFLETNNSVSALKVLDAILKHLGSIWPARLTLEGVSLGDTWSHPDLEITDKFESLVPFHKLSQWLSYSILDACVVAGIAVTDVEKLTGLPEYRNGGLFLDLGLISAKDKNFLTKGVTVDEPFTVEWRAMTVILLDDLAKRIQKKLHKTPAEFPLAKVLEGGSWWAGRKIASQLRSGGTPPINIISDGTVF